jgi:hypothetical protein
MSKTYDNIVAVSHPATESLLQMAGLYPVFPMTVDDALLEQRPCEEDCYKQHRSCGVDERHRPQAHELDYLHRRHVTVLVQYIHGQGEADETRKRNRSNSCADRRGRIARQLGRRASRCRKIEWDDVDEREHNLQVQPSIPGRFSQHAGQ